MPWGPAPRSAREKGVLLAFGGPPEAALRYGCQRYMSELPKGSVAGFVTAGHAVLFEDNEATRCDVCADALGPPSEELNSAGDANAHVPSDSESGFDVRGRGLLVWSRGEERRYQEPPLCASCAAAIGVTALQRWEIEEEEG